MKAKIKMQTFQKTYLFDNIELISLSIKYPFVILNKAPNAQAVINNQIIKEVNEFFRYVSSILYNEAIKSYLYAKENNFPFHPYEAIMEYVVTYNNNCFLSYYYDQYTYTGGAHGMTIRTSNTFELVRGTMLPLYCYFKSGVNYKWLLTQEIIKQANDRLKDNPGIYFDDYESLILNTFNEDHYFLTPEGLSIYFQQYDIAPYSTGIVVFTIPYETIGWYPSC